MKKRIEMVEIKEEKMVNIIEIDFPVYRKIDLSNDQQMRVIYSKIDSKDDGLFEETLITISDGDCDTEEKFEFEIKIYPKDRFLDGSGVDYWFGGGIYKSNREKFIEVLIKIYAEIDHIRICNGIIN